MTHRMGLLSSNLLFWSNFADSPRTPTSTLQRCPAYGWRKRIIEDLKAEYLEAEIIAW
jgi:hypothetical protein